MAERRVPDEVTLDGTQIVARRQGDEAMLLRQETHTVIGPDRVDQTLKGMGSGIEGHIASDSPEVLEHFERYDKVQKNIALLERPPAPAPNRERELDPGRTPKGQRVCPICGGAKMKTDEVGAEVICPRCNGDGYVPLGIGLTPLY